MEPRGATGVYDAETDSYTLYACSQSAGVIRNQAAPIIGVAQRKLRVITDDVGGAFGMKTPVYPEYLAVLVAAKKTGRPVHWMSTRSEAFMTDTQARDTYTDAELALDDKGKFLALRMKHLCGQGAYVTPAGIGINTNNFARCLPGMYRIPKIDFSAKCVFTNTAPIGPYRGAGRPEGELRARPRGGRSRPRHRHRHRAVAPEKPHSALLDALQDARSPQLTTAAISRRMFAKALELADYKDFNKRKREAARRKKCRGIGISCMLEHAGALPTESASLSFPGGDKLDPGAQRAIDRAKPRHGVRPAAGRPARHRPQDHRAPAWRQFARDRRLRLGRLALGHGARATPSSRPPI